MELVFQFYTKDHKDFALRETASLNDVAYGVYEVAAAITKGTLIGVGKGVTKVGVVKIVIGAINPFTKVTKIVQLGSAICDLISCYNTAKDWDKHFQSFMELPLAEKAENIAEYLTVMFGAEKLAQSKPLKKALDKIVKIAKIEKAALEGLIKVKFGDTNYNVTPNVQAQIRNAEQARGAPFAGKELENAINYYSNLEKCTTAPITSGVSQSATNWCMPAGGCVINGRRYTEHALERMAPNCPEVRAELQFRFYQRAVRKNMEIGSEKYIEGLQDYVNPRFIPPLVVENVIRNGTKVSGDKPGTYKFMGSLLKVITNLNGDVVTVHKTGK